MPTMKIDPSGDIEQFEMVISESLHEYLERSANPREEWLWCIFCESFFQAKHLRIDYLGNLQGCAFCGCAGFDCAIFKWDTFREEDDPLWPASVSDLTHGLHLGAEETTGDSGSEILGPS
jgi:hypothetical protein